MPEDPAALAFAAVLLVARLGAVGLLLPGLGEAEVPMPVRLGLVLALVPLLLPVLPATLPPEPPTPGEALRLLAGEVAVGLWIGWLARLAGLALQMAGQLAATFLGLTSLLAPDPSGGGTTALGRAMAIGGVALALSSGLYAIPLAAVAESYAVLPVGGPLLAEVTAPAIAAAGAESLALALRLSAPLLLVSLLAQIATGLLSRVAPQAQVFVLAAPVQTLAGLAVLAVLLPALLARWTEAAGAAWRGLPGAG